jgi:iron(III) transport system permease protein
MNREKILNFFKNNKGIIFLNLLLIWIIFSFIIYPNISLIKNTFILNGNISFRAFEKLLSSERAMKSLVNSFILAISLSITVNIFGIFIVLITEYFDIKGSKILKLGYFTPMIYGGIILASGYKLIYGETGLVTLFLAKFFPNLPLNWFEGYLPVLFTMTFACTSNHLIFLTNAIRGMDYQIIEAARNMGAKDYTIIFKILIPILKPVLFALTILTFLTGLSAVSAPLILGGEEFQTINPMIIVLAKSRYSRDIAMLLSLILGAVTIGILLFMNKLERGKNYISVSKAKTVLKKQKLENKFLNILVHILAYIIFLIYLFPIIIVILFSFSDINSIIAGRLNLATLTIAHYKKLFTDIASFKPYLVSLGYSAIASIGVIIFTMAISKLIHKKNTKLARFYEYSCLIPWLLPATLIALGFMTTYDSPKVIIFNNVLVGTPIIMVLAYIVVKIPFSFRMLRAAFFSVEDSLEEAAKSMGASAFYTFRKVVLPIILPSALAIGALNFNALLTDYDLSVFLYHPLLEPLGIVIMKNTAVEADMEAKAMIYVYSVTLMIISSLVIYYVYGRKTKVNKK